MNQLAFSFQPLSRRSDPQTSKDAAEHSTEFRAKHEARIFGALVDASDRGMTYREIAAATGLEPVAVARDGKCRCGRKVARLSRQPDITAETVRLHGTDQRHEVADRFKVTREVQGAQVKRGKLRPAYSYMVTLIKESANGRRKV